MSVPPAETRGTLAKVSNERIPTMVSIEPGLFIYIYAGALLMFITGLPMLFLGACLGMLAEKVEKAIDRYFERRVAKRGHRL